jgi:alkyl sulfatase BDS1-like metallo-beta-lactamase superfamily hydrolase
MMKRFLFAATAITLLVSPAFAQVKPKPPTAATKAANAAFAKTLPTNDARDQEFAMRGFIAPMPNAPINTPEGRSAWDVRSYDFAKGDTPDTVNPSLWRLTKLHAKAGLFQVREGIWQVRGIDVSNITFIATKTGYLVVDPLTTAEVASAAYKLLKEKVADKPIVAVIYTHSHGDHFGGARGVVSQADLEAGKVRIIAPEGFMEHAISENVIAGNAMSRRAAYQFGTALPRGVTGQVNAGLGLALSGGSLGLIPPTELITKTGQELEIDGLTVQFQLTPGTEAPSEMNFYIPSMKALCLAENANGTMHNILTPRGALVRDAKAWAGYLNEALTLYGDKTDVLFTPHFWPRWGNAEISDYIGKHRDAYKYLHDQSVRMMNQGLTGPEIADQIALPPALSNEWYNRDYYGTLRFNARAVYQRYMGFYDANPANLNPLVPTESAPRTIALMGGAAPVLKAAQASFAKGEYRWVAELLNKLVFAEPTNKAAKDLLADTYEQLGYQAESAIWRNIYLSGAMELRNGLGAPRSTSSSLDTIRNTPTADIIDLLSVRLNGPKAVAAPISLDLVFPDRKEHWRLSVANGVLIGTPNPKGAAAGTTYTLPRAAFLGILGGQATMDDLVRLNAVKIEGEVGALGKFLGLMDTYDPMFPIVTP